MVSEAVSRSIGSRLAALGVVVLLVGSLLWLGAGATAQSPPVQDEYAKKTACTTPVLSDHTGLYCETASGLLKTFSTRSGRFLGFIHSGNDPKESDVDPFADDEADGDGPDTLACAPAECPRPSGGRYELGAREPHCVTPSSPFPEHYAHVLYVTYQESPPSEANRYENKVEEIRQIVREVNGLLHDTAKELGKPLLYKVRCQGGDIQVDNVILTQNCGQADCFNDMVDQLRSPLHGYNDVKVKYWIWTPDTRCGCGGKGHMFPDDSLASGNRNNGFAATPTFAITFHGSTGIRVMMHENGHNMGAVQDSPDFATYGMNNAGHCWDGNDIMCYEEPTEEKDYEGTQLDDEGPPPVCNGEDSWDCNHDTYFHPKPPAGSYLAQHWNLGSPLNRYLVPGNAMPDARPDTATMLEDGPTISINVLSNDSDEEGDPISLDSIETPPTSGGTASVVGSLVQYKPPKDFFGTDTFVYKVRDREVGNESIMYGLGTVTVTVQPVNDPPTALGDEFTTKEDKPVSFKLIASDIEGEPLAWTILQPPAHGELLGSPPDLVYEPHADFYGGTDTDDMFRYQVEDVAGLKADARVYFKVLPVPDPPNARPDMLFAPNAPGVDWNLRVLDNDDAGPGPEAELEAFWLVQDGTATTTFCNADVAIDADEGVLVYTAPATWPTACEDEPRLDWFDYTVEDATGLTGTARVDIEILPEDLLALPDFYTVAEDQTLTVAPEEGILFTPSPIVPPGASIDPADNWPGKPDTSTIDVEVVTEPAHGTLTVDDDGSFVYQPHADYHGVDVFEYVIHADERTSNKAVVEITVESVNDAPVADYISTNVTEDSAVALLLTGADVEDGPEGLTVELLEAPRHGRLLGEAPGLTYIPDLDFSGEDSFTYRVIDRDGATHMGRVEINVTSVNDAPVANPDKFRVRVDTPTSFTAAGGVLANDHDADGDAMYVRVHRAPEHGALVLARDGGFEYTPTQGFVGYDSFIYRAVDAKGVASDAKPVTLEIVLNVPPVPLFDIEGGIVEVGKTVPIREASYDRDGKIIEWTWDFGDGSLPRTGRVPSHTYSANGTHMVSLTVRDNDGVAMTERMPLLVSGDMGAEHGGDAPTPRPVADAGEDRFIVAGRTVTLDGSASTGVEELSYSWRQTDGPDVRLTRADSVMPFFTAPETDAPEKLTFALVVFDGSRVSQEDTVELIVQPRSDAPVGTVDVGPDLVTLSGAPVEATATLEGLRGLPTFTWRQVEGAPVPFATGGPKITFRAPYVQQQLELVFEARATVDGVTTQPARLKVSVLPETAPQGFETLDTEGAHAFRAVLATDGAEDLAFQWDFGDGATGTGPEAVHAFTGPGKYTVRLTATNDLGYAETWSKDVEVQDVPAEEPLTEASKEGRSAWLWAIGLAVVVAVALGIVMTMVSRRRP